MKDYSSQLQQIISKAAPILKALNEDHFNLRSAPGKWSKKEILGHLIDSAYNNHQRFIRAEKQGNLIFSGYDPEDWVIKNNYQQRGPVELVDTWVTTNKHLAILLAQLSATAYEQQYTDHNFHQICMIHPAEEESTSLAYLAEDYIFHLEHHLAQLIEGYVKLAEEV